MVELSGFYLSGLGFVVGGALFWVLYFDLKDHLNPEPRRMLLLGFLMGCLSAVAAWWIFRLTDLLGLPQPPGNTIPQILVVCVAIGGPIEEGMKFLAARLFLFRSHHFDEPIDGLVYASAVAIGFLAPVPTERIVKVGNAAMQGAREVLLDRQLRAEIERVCQQVEHVELETKPDFFDAFVDGCMYNPMPDRLP